MLSLKKVHVVSYNSGKKAYDGSMTDFPEAFNSDFKQNC